MKAIFFLGGDDAEMRRIAKILEEAGVEYHDAGLNWGAKASAYGDTIAEVAKTGKTPVLVELEVDCNLPKGTVIIDHHGDRSGEPPAIIQVLSLLGIEPSREDILTGAMDAAFVFGLESIGAKKEEIAGFLGLSPDSVEGMSMRDMLLATESGFSDEIIAEAERAIAEREQVGDMIVVRSAHSKTSPITSRLVGEQDTQNILILSGDGEVNYYGIGETVRELAKRFPGGWTGGAGLHLHTPEAKVFWEQWGGAAPNNAFWGGYPDQEEILDFLSKKFS